jgi:class 3 adenylate cyclase/tetratricopeptide (TPR) repeat protein
VVCSACGTDNRAGRRFCSQCGNPLALECPSCGAANEPADRFCGECGGALTDARPAPAGSTAQLPVVPERRLVSVLFADLVGFTTLSEHRDPEEVNELMAHYFERCRTLIERYGGTVVKFIGDAVMAVWGTPVAREDDAERAVRAALSLTRAVTALGEEVGMPELQVRAGVLTGSAAVEVGQENEGMLMGDSVNTASRLQSIAQPGTVLVDDATRRASEAAIAYEDAGTHHVKGREQPVRTFQALRVVAGSRGARRSVGVEAPFVGRDTELQAIIDAGERSTRESCATHVAVVGEAGSGKSRLLWEYFKYIDGIKEEFWWHQGRCLAYGEGVAYWALAEIVRSRAGILEEETQAVAREKLRAAVEAQVPDERERRMVEPRLAHLLRLDERPEADRADLFSGWRLFFERMAESGPVVMVIEDLQWADSGLLDFIDYLLEWSAEHPIFVLTLARPDLIPRRPNWKPLMLEPLAPTAVAAMLEGLAPGLPDDLVAEITRRADGIPLYVVETIRMLQDRGVLVAEGDRYVVKGDVSDLDVPESLHALVASRLDGLSPNERSLLQDASVLGHSFGAAAAATISGRTEAEVVKLLDGLVDQQVLARDDDPRSPERGQYVFLQTLLQTVAYGTLSRHVRKSRHVAAARHLEQTWPGEAYDIAEVLASHYLEAIRADPEADDVQALRAAARERLTDAGRAAASLALGPEAQRYFAHAAELADEDSERARLFEQAGQALAASGDADAAEAHLRQAIELYERSGAGTGGSAAVTLAGILRFVGRVDESLELLEPFRSETATGVDPVTRALALVALSATILYSGGEPQDVGPLLEEGLATLEAEQAWPALADALVARAAYLMVSHRNQEGIAVLRHSLALSEEHDLPTTALRARFNLAGVALASDRLEDAISEINLALAMARERGDRSWELGLMSQSISAYATLGRWDECTTAATPLLAGPADLNAASAAGPMVTIAAARGDEQTLERCRFIAEERRESAHVDEQVAGAMVRLREMIEHGDAAEAAPLVRAALEIPTTGHEIREQVLALGAEAAIMSADDSFLAELIRYVDELPPALATPLLRSGRARLRAEEAHRAGNEADAEVYEREAIDLLRDVGARPLLALALLERNRRRGDDEALAEARAIYADLGATAWLTRIDEPSGLAA